MSLLGDLSMNLKLNIDNFTANMKKASDEIDETEKKYAGVNKVGGIFEDVGKKLTLGVTMPVIGAGTAAVKFGSNLEENMAKVSTLADETQVPISQLREGIINLSNDTGESTDILSEAMYQALSSGVQTTDVVEFLTQAVKDAKGGFTDTSTAVDGLTSTLNAYGKQTSEANELSNQMMITQNLGKTTFGELSSVMGNVAPTANALKVGTDELLSSFAVLTANGIKTSESASGLKAAFSNIIKPSTEASKAAESLGLQFNASAVESKGWMGFLKDVKAKLSDMAPEYTNAIDKQSKLKESISALEKAGKKNTDEYKNMKNELKKVTGDIATLEKGSNSTISAFATMFGSVEGLNSVLTLTSDQGMTLYNKSMQQMASGSDEVQKAYDKMENTTSAQFQKVKENFKNTLAEVGVQLLPMVTEALKGIKGLIDKFNGLSESTKENILKIVGITAAVGPVITVVGKLFTSIQSIHKGILLVRDGYKVVKGLKVVKGIGGLLSPISKLKGALNFTSIFSVLKGGATSVIGVFGKLKGALSIGKILGLIASPAGIAVASIAGVATAGVLLYKNWDTVKAKCSETWGAVVTGVKNFGKNIGDGFNDMKKDVSHNFNVATARFKKNVGILWNDVSSACKKGWGVIEKGVSPALNSIKKGLKSGLKSIKNFPGEAMKWGKDIMEGFHKGIKEKIDFVLSPIKAMAKGIKKLIHFSRPDEGPLREYEEWMPDFMSGLGKGISDNQDLVLNPLKNLTENMNISSALSLKPSIQPQFSSNLGSASNGDYINNAPILKVENLYVTDKQDIDNISRSIYNENMKVIRAFGVKK